MPYPTRRTLTAAAVTAAAPVLAGLSFAAASFATAPQAPQVDPAPPAPATAQPAPPPTQLIAAGAGTFAGGGLSGADRTVPGDEVEARLLEWISMPGEEMEAHCSGTLSLDRPGRRSVCTVTDEDGQRRTYYGYVSGSLPYGSDYQLFYAEDEPLSEAGAAALNGPRTEVVVHPVYDETDTLKPDTLAAQQAVGVGNRILEMAGERELRIVSVVGPVDLTRPEPVEAVAEERSTGAVRIVQLLPVVMEGESPVLVVSVQNA